MRAEETIKHLDDKEFLDKLYGYAYKRCGTSHEAEDLCSDIVLSILKGIRKNPDIRNFYAFAWTVAHRVYADFAQKRKMHTGIIEYDECCNAINMQTNDIDEYLETEEDTCALKHIIREISFLSKIYRDVMVMYYLDGMKTADIAVKLGISENNVKQRLFSARNTVKKEAEKMDNDYTLKPVEIAFVGSGNPVGNDPRVNAERVLSQNVVYLCKNTARSAKEISEMLNIPMVFIEDELEIQCRGANGSYGLLRRLDNGKYISNIIILDIPEYEAANHAYTDILEEFCARLKIYIDTNKARILSFPFLNKQNDVRFITWSLISPIIWSLDSAVRDILHKKYFSDVKVLKREFSTVGFAVKSDEKLNMGFYGCDGISANNICGYSEVRFTNIYGNRIEKHCGCGHNISTDKTLMMTIRVVDGLDVESLSDEDKEIAAKAIECGYIKRADNILRRKFSCSARRVKRISIHFLSM
ncbi:MAG: RNA polymerase sigma factor [Eubacteriales bacterium]